MNIKEIKILDKLFELSIFVKGFEGVLEIISTFLILYTVEKHQLLSFVLKITQHELSQDPHDFLVNRLIEFVMTINPGLNFGIIYLFVQGTIKIFLTIFLLKKKIWAYPVAIYIFFTLDILLLIKFFSSFSLIYLGLTITNFMVALLTIWEYKRISKLKF